jgi:hypothetical protein
MAEGFGAEQTLKKPRIHATMSDDRRFPVGRAARTWQIAAPRTATAG